MSSLSLHPDGVRSLICAVIEQTIADLRHGLAAGTIELVHGQFRLTAKAQAYYARRNQSHRRVEDQGGIGCALDLIQTAQSREFRELLTTAGVNVPMHECAPAIARGSTNRRDPTWDISRQVDRKFRAWQRRRGIQVTVSPLLTEPCNCENP